MEIQLFNSPQFGEIRAAGTPDAPLFCLADICKILDLGNPSQVKARLSAKETQVIDLHALISSEGMVGNSLATFVTESGLYKVIFQSRKAEAVAFQEWVTEEVLPQIRRTGGYIPISEQDTDQDILAKAVLIANKSLEEKERRIQVLEGQKKMLEDENKTLAPKAEYTDEVLQSTTTYTHTQMAKELNFRSVNVFLQECQKEGILFRQSGMWMLYSKYGNKGYMKTRTTPYRTANGDILTNTITVWTEEGRRFLHEKFNVALQPVDLTMFDFTGRDL